MSLRDTSWYASNAVDYLAKSFAGNLVRYAPNGMAPLFALSSMGGDKTAGNVEHGYFSKTMVFPEMTVTTTVNSAATALVVGDTTNVLAGDLYRNQTTGEIIRVASVTSGTGITMVRAVGQVAAAAITAADKLYGVGTAFEQGSNAPTSRLMAPTRVINYTQIFRNSWSLPGTVTAIKAIVGNGELAESKQDCALFHAADIEKGLLFGQKWSGTINSQFATAMDGVIETVRRLANAANTTAAGGTTTFTQLETALDPCFNVVNDGRNGNDRTVFVGGKALTVLNNIGRLNGTYQLQDGQTSFGLQFRTMRTSRGTFRLIEHPLFNSNTDWAKMAVAVDLPTIKLAYLNGRKQINQTYGAGGDNPDSLQDAMGGTLTSELTVEILNPNANAVITGLTAAAAG